jgi:fructose transport system ATP-binding protein
MADYILETRGLTKHYGGIHALEDASFTLAPGEHVAVVGDNGAGKSTFVRQVTGVEKPTAGQIFLDGKEVHFKDPLEAREAGIETVFQTLALADDLDVPSNLFLGREIVRIPLGPFSWLDRRKMRKLTVEALQKTAVKIPNIDNRIRNMSGGQRQCVAIARAAAFASKLVIMDEPTAALAVREIEHVLDLIRTLKGQGIAVILISHRLTDVFAVCDRIIALRQGQVIADEMTAETSMNAVVAHIVGAA